LRRLDRVEDDRALELVHSDAERRVLERRLARSKADLRVRPRRALNARDGVRAASGTQYSIGEPSQRVTFLA